MKLTRRKIILLMAALLLITSVFFLPRNVERDRVKIIQTEKGFKSDSNNINSWICAMPTILDNKRLVIIENAPSEKSVVKWYIYKYCKIKLFKDEDYWPRFYIRILNLTDGKNVFEYELTYYGMPSRAHFVFKYDDYLVVSHDDNPPDDHFTPPSAVSVISKSGKLINRFLIDDSLEGVDDKYNLLVLGKYELDEENRKYFLTRLQFIALPSDRIVFEIKDLRFKSADLDGLGNIFTMKHDGTIEKYSIIPWKQLWSVNIGRTYDGIKYDHSHLVAFDYTHPPEDPNIDEKGIMIDPEDGKIVRENYVFDFHSDEAEFDGIKYKVTFNDLKISVERIESETSN